MLRGIADLAKAQLLGLRRDRETGHLWYPVDGIRLHVRFRSEVMREVYRRRTFEQVYFKHYRPTGSNVVVDFGAGLGTEIVRLAKLEPELRYIAVEIQPWVYECLCLTLAQLPGGFEPTAIAVGSQWEARLTPTTSGDDVSIDGGPVRVPMIRWSEFAQRYNVGRIDLLKMNIEGGEADLLNEIDLGCVGRVIVNVHDFRADRGEGEHFRTRAKVIKRLRDASFDVLEDIRDWIYAQRIT